MKKYILISITFVLCLALQGCFIFGVRTHLHWIGKNDYRKLYKRNKIKHEEELYLDKTFAAHIKKIYGNDTNARHDHLQPVQYLLFDKQGKLISFMINCYAYTNLLLYADWNHEHLFDTFPTLTMRPVDDLLTLPDVLKMIKDTSGQSAHLDVAGYDYIEVVTFSSVIYRASKELIHTVKHQDKKGYRVKTLFVNSNNSFLWQHMDAEQKKKVKDY